MKFLKTSGVVILLLILLFFLGPRPDFKPVNGSIATLDLSIEAVESYLEKKQSKVKDLRPGNGYQLQFFDGKKQTAYALIYLHGFSASPVEGAPLNADFARKYGMNYYAPLLSDHGRSTIESFVNSGPQDWIDDAAEAIAIGRILGEKIIIMSCSTGSTLATYLDAKNPGAIAGHLMYSPNFNLEDSKSKLLTGPWGLPLARWVQGSDYRSFTLPDAAMPYWTTKYRIEGLISLRSLIDQTMTTEVWEAIKTPFLIAYYYENEEQKDEVISVDAITAFGQSSKTPKPLQRIIPMPEPKSHVILSPLQSKNVEVVERATYDFAEEVLKT